MPEYPLAFAGIFYDRVITTIGVNQHVLSNLFSCLVNGIVSRNGRVTSTRNVFENIGYDGIWSTGGVLFADHCTFKDTGDIGILVRGTGVFNAVQNYFSGSWWEGIHTEGGASTHSMIIYGNDFDMDGARWTFGIYAERPQGAFGINARIDSNTLVLGNNHTAGVNCIRIVDKVDATSEMLILQNSLTINSNPAAGPVNGIYATLGNSDNLVIEDNNIEYTVDQLGFGIWLTGDQAISKGHIMRTNEILGTSADPGDDPLTCGFHSTNVNGTEYCDNTVDLSVWGFHFLGGNDVMFRENHINHHSIGLGINTSPAFIGPQFGRGNRWSTDPDAVATAASVSFGNPFLSEFRVPEDDDLPWLPPSGKLFPDPGTLLWFHYSDTTSLDYCDLHAEALPRSLTPAEKEVVNNTTTLGGAMLWELKRATYTKLLLFPELRPSSSPEETFFNYYAGSRLDSLANVSLQVRDALYLSNTDQDTLNDYWADAKLALDTLASFDENTDFSVPDSLTEVWFELRDTLLQDFSANAAAEDSFHVARNELISTALQSALEYNAEISTTQPYESAQKILSELRIRRLLDLPMTEDLYEAALLLALDTSLRSAANLVVGLLDPCDQQLYSNWDEGHEQSEERHGKSVGVTGILRVSPNPSTGLIELNLPPHQAGMLSVYNAHGQQVVMLSILADALQSTLDLRQQPQGLYWVVLTDPEGKVSGSSKISILR
ncbi:MAG: T9SS type A sorting domain-containing protein [Phycisphaerae bacterium]|nr:T9SS type A sorting domain-containing protein [Saprospiraceae bacterium]